jgi:hypothetical protein
MTPCGRPGVEGDAHHPVVEQSMADFVGHSISCGYQVPASAALLCRAGKDSSFEVKTEQLGPEFDRVEERGQVKGSTGQGVPGQAPERAAGRIRNLQKGHPGVIRV